MDLSGFIRISKYAGMREDLVQAGGGNSAYKISQHEMAIKASGYQMADVSQDNGYAVVDPQLIRDFFMNCDDLEKITSEQSKGISARAFIQGERPSIETFLHSISGRYSLHTHPIVVNALTCRENGTETLLQLFPNALVVPYATPGIELAKAYFREYKKYCHISGKEPQIVFLLNHGLIVSAETADEVIQLTDTVIRKVEHYLNVDMTAYHDISRIYQLFGNGVIWLVTDENVRKSYNTLHGPWEHYFCPDCVVFLGKKIFQIDSPDIDIAKFQAFEENEGCPNVIGYNGNLYLHADSVKKALEMQSVLSFSAQVMLLNQDTKCCLLSESEKNFLLNWDAEKYRKNMK